MVFQTSEGFKKKFLLEFTRELIRNSMDVEMFKLERLVKEQESQEIKTINLELKKGQEEIFQGKKEIKKIIRKINRGEEGYVSSIKKEPEKEGGAFMEIPYKGGLIKRTLPYKGPIFIPEPRLPERLQYLRPLPMPGEIDLGKINNFIRDPVVRIIECNGPDKEIIMSGLKGTKETNVKLSKEEIEGIIKKFSDETKIPLEEGFFKVVYGKLVLSSIYSESIGSKFIIKKIATPPPPRANFFRRRY